MKGRRTEAQLCRTARLQERHLKGCTVCLFVCFLQLADGLFGSAGAQEATSNELRPISVEDVVRETIVGDPNSLDWHDRSSSAGVVSPDGKHVAVAIRWGNDSALTNEAKLLVFETSTLLRNPLPHEVARFAATGNAQPLALVRWLPDSTNLIFAGTRESGPTQVYKVDTSNSRSTQLTRGIRPLIWFDITPDSQYLAEFREPSPKPMSEDAQCLKSGCRVTQQTFYAASQGTAELSYPVTRWDLRTGELRTLEPAERIDGDLLLCTSDLKGGLSPNGRYGVQECVVRKDHWPAWWVDYTAYPHLGQLLKGGDISVVRQLVLRDFAEAKTDRLTSAPYPIKNFGNASYPLWIDQGRGLVLAGALEPLEGLSEQDKIESARRYAVLLIDPATRAVQRISALSQYVSRISSASWDPQNETLTVKAQDATGKQLPDFRFRRHGSRWSAAIESRPNDAERGKLKSAISLVLRQSLNSPPRLFAVSRDGRQEREVLDPNPWLARRKLGRVEAVQWISTNGREWRGGLYYPTDYDATKRYPLVLQTHGFDANKFSLSGITKNFIAQPLAGVGIMVLQVAENTAGAQGADQWPAVQEGYESAIDYLDKRGLIDPGCVGMLGWSWTGPTVGYTLTHSSFPIAAAAFSDTADFGWWWYLLQGGRHGESEYGTPPFGSGLEVWRQMSPSFNLDRIHTPMMMWSGGGVSGLWDWYTVLQRLGKPVEYWSMPDGTHELFKIGERLRAYQLFVDWFRFWLQGEEVSGTAKFDQYARWHEFREYQNHIPSS